MTAGVWDEEATGPAGTARGRGGIGGGSNGSGDESILITSGCEKQKHDILHLHHRRLK